MHLITRKAWENKLNRVKIRKEDMNKLVMDFLVIEGYAEAAEIFRMESGTDLVIDPATVAARMAVKRAVLCGNIEEAIDKIIGLNLDESFLEEIERTVSLLAFVDVWNCPERRLMDESRLLKLASDVNVAILSYQNLGEEPRLDGLLRMLICAQFKLGKTAVYPRINILLSADSKTRGWTGEE
ncbi:Detected protein of confused Function [Hibiscus syriacus]|uniref:Detected protein of confused Function n=1 Tax=Hibiscus syriacus TaxID=106335 RepID=A0A6A3C4Y0_HIBSY|nr:Detected protein of confused Function [Hibiscus syriacus]